MEKQEDFIAFEKQPNGTSVETARSAEVGNPKPFIKDSTDGRRNGNAQRPPISPLDFTMRNAAPWLHFRALNGAKTGAVYNSHFTRRLHEEILDFVNYATPTVEEHAARQHIVDLIEYVMLQKFPQAQMKLFGSFDTRMYLPTADIDLVLFGDFGEMPKFRSRNGGSTHLRNVAKVLVAAGIPAPGSVKIISKARIPLIKFTDALFHFDVDISFNVESGIESAEIMKALIDLLPSVKPLTLVLKQFLLMRQLNEVFTGGLGSYSVTLLIVSFLQMHPLVQAKQIKPEENYGVLLLEFLELYGKNFAYETVGISLRNGGFYFDKLQRGWCASERLLLCVEDPQNDTNDVAKSSYALSNVRHAFEHAFNTLTCIAVDIEMRQRRDRAFQMPDDASVLSAILHFPEEVLQHRAFVRSLYATRTQEK